MLGTVYVKACLVEVNEVQTCVLVFLVIVCLPKKVIRFLYVVKALVFSCDQAEVVLAQAIHSPSYRFYGFS